MKTQFSRQYVEFRELLQNNELQMFQQTLKILAYAGIKENKLIQVRAPDISPRFCIYVFRQGELLSLLGGHWLRKGEPTPAYLKEINGLVSNLKEGKALV
jgi:hypothetical protein